MKRLTARFRNIMTCIFFFWISWAAAAEETSIFAYTYQRADGNRFVEGSGRFPNMTHVDIDLDGLPMWLVAAADRNQVVWLVVLEGGATQAFSTVGKTVTSIDVKPSRLPGETPPLLMLRNGNAQLLQASRSPKAAYSHPVLLPQSGKTAEIYTDGRLALRKEETQLLGIDALPDARPVFDENERLLILTGRTEDYRHGILGDRIEAKGVTLIPTSPIVSANPIIELNEGSVIEGTAPLWSDLNGDGEREIILTVSDSKKGSRFMVFNNDGSLKASGPAVGQGFRWRHQIAVAPFGPEGEIELAGVRTPHIGGVVEFFRLEGDTLRRTGHIKGYSSHIIGSRNLDMAAAGDFDGDGSIELLLPLQSFERLAAVRHTDEGVRSVWELLLPGKLTTNLAAVTLPDGNILLGTGSDSHTLRLWLQH